MVNSPRQDDDEKKKGGLPKPIPGLLADADKMKDDLHENLEVKEYNVFDYYYETGFWQALAKDDRFGNITLGIISLNAVWIGVDSDHNTKPPPDTDLVFVVADQFFCIFFTFEWLTRFMAFAKKKSCLKDGWFKFDSALVFLMVLETWIMPIMGGSGGGMGNTSMLRLLRLLRLSRMARLMRSVPELLTLLKGMAAATRSVFSTLVLLIVFTYVFAIIFKQQTEGDEDLEWFFGTIPEAMWNLLLGGTLLDGVTDHLNLLRERNQMCCVVFLLWVLLSSFTILNMLIGVLCEVVSAVSDSEKEKALVSFAKSSFLTVLETIDKDGNGTLSEKEFETFVMHNNVKAPLDDLEVDRDNLMDLSDVIFSTKKPEKSANTEPGTPALTHALSGLTESTGTGEKRRSSLKMMEEPVERELKFGELLEMILDLRAGNPAMVGHIVDLRKHLRINQSEIKDFFMEVDSDVEEIKEKQDELEHGLKEEMRRLFEIHDLKTQDNIKHHFDKVMAHQQKIVSEMILPLTIGIRELQQQIACSHVVPIPLQESPFEPPAPPTNKKLEEMNPPGLNAICSSTDSNSTPERTGPRPAKNMASNGTFKTRHEDTVCVGCGNPIHNGMTPQDSLRHAATFDECRIDIGMDSVPCDSQIDGHTSLESIAAEGGCTCHHPGIKAVKSLAHTGQASLTTCQPGMNNIRASKTSSKGKSARQNWNGKNLA